MQVCASDVDLVLRLSTNRQDDKTEHVTAKQLTQQLMHPPPSPLWSTGGRHWDATSTAWSAHAAVPGAAPNQHRSSDRKQMSSGFSSDSGGAASGWQSNSSELRTAPAEVSEKRHPEEQGDAVRQNRASLPQRFSEQKWRTMNDLVQHHAPLRAKRVPRAQECSRALRPKHVHVLRLELPRVRAEDKPGGALLARPLFAA